MPPGNREMSFRSSASRALTEILVALAISRSEVPRRSRASRIFLPKSVDRSAVMQLRALHVREPVRACQTAAGSVGRVQSAGSRDNLKVEDPQDRRTIRS